jgi:signal transduction histidine kinase/DNA-binding LacI/PurR family transcriptional regulator/AraC-like DNA-binding protein
MGSYKHRQPTVGVLAGWEAYENANLVNFLGPLFHGVRAAAHDRGCNLLLACGVGFPGGQIGGIHPAWPALSPETDFVPVGPWNTDGLIVVNPLVSETRIRHVLDLRDAGHPVVFVGTALGGPAIAIDNAGGIRQAMAHLVQHGHRCIAFIAGNPEDTHGDSEERLQAYQSAVREYGLEANPHLVAYGYHIVDGGRLAMRQLLGAGLPFTAVLASSDECAIGAMIELKNAGLRIPQDVAIVGFDDQPEAIVQAPPLTSVHSLTVERGCRALELLLDYVEGRKGEIEIVKVPTRLTVRQSCGCLMGTPALSGTPFSCAGAGTVTSRLADAMAEAVLTEARCLSSDQVHTLCRSLVQAFVASLAQGDPAGFRVTLEGILRHTEEAGDDAHAWQSALSALRSELPAFLETQGQSTMRPQADDVLHQARIAVSAGLQHQYRRYVFDQRTMADRVSLLSARLLTALDETQIFQVLAEHLPEVGIRYAGVAFFEPAGDDPAAWSVLHALPHQPGSPFRFPSRDFPPVGLYEEPFSLALLPLVSQEEPPGFAAFDTGNLELCGAILQQLIAALKMARLYRAADEGRRLAEEANRLKGRFLSTVSHELRTPLNLIVGLSRLLLRQEASGPPLPPPYHQDLERIHASAQHLDGLIRDVLDLAQSEMGQLKLVGEPLDLAEVLQVVALVGEHMARDKGLAWRAEIPPDLPQVWGDRTRLRQVALNLVSNAVKFTERGEVTLRTSAGEQIVTVSVSDTGLGIPLEEQEVIFDEFRQSERTAARGYGGLGLGLAICERLVLLHGGEIGVRSSGQEGAGSTFYFTLPVMETPALASATPALPLAAEQRMDSSAYSSATVLLLAELPGSGERLRDHLTRQGFVVSVLRIDQIADWLSHLVAVPPGAVVLDVALASARGWEILRLLKGNPATRDIPVLFYSLAQERDSGAMLELETLTKPLGAAELAQALERQGFPTGEGHKTILIVDDEPGILEMHARVVQAHSAAYRVLKARNGRQALDKMRRERPDLVLLDLMMPELDGFGVLERMQAEKAIRHVPVIVLTGQVLTEEDMARLNRGVATVLSKGIFSVEETLAHVEGALARTRKLGSEAQRLVRKAMAYIHEHYAEPLAREDVAHYVSVSEDYLTRCFRQELGVTPVAYLNRYRVKQAKLLLAAGDKNVTEVALAVGFSDSNYFSRVFRQEAGMSPRAYRRHPPAGSEQPAGG